MRTRNLSAAAVILVLPVLEGVFEVLRVRAEPPGASATAAERLSVIEANLDVYVAAGWVGLAVGLLIIPAFLALHRLAAPASPRWARVGLLLGFGWGLGWMAHLGGNFGIYPILATHPDRETAAEMFATELPFWIALDAPWLLGVVLGPVVMAVALKRAGVLRGLNLGLVAGATVLLVLVGSGMTVAVGWAGLMVLGFLPAAARVAGQQRDPVPAPEAVHAR
jgi:hypothetical protein